MRRRYVLWAAMLTVVGSLLSPVGPARAESVDLCDIPLRDEPDPGADILCAQVTYARRLVVNTEVTGLRPTTALRAILDPAAEGTGPTFMLRAHVLPDGRTASRGQLLMAAAGSDLFSRIGCADIRTRAVFSGDAFNMSIPSRCMGRHARLGAGISVRLHSLAADGGDFMPNNPPATFRVLRN